MLARAGSYLAKSSVIKEKRKEFFVFFCPVSIVFLSWDKNLIKKIMGVGGFDIAGAREFL